MSQDDTIDVGIVIRVRKATEDEAIPSISAQFAAQGFEKPTREQFVMSYCSMTGTDEASAGKIYDLLDGPADAFMDALASWAEDRADAQQPPAE